MVKNISKRFDRCFVLQRHGKRNSTENRSLDGNTKNRLSSFATIIIAGISLSQTK